MAVVSRRADLRLCVFASAAALVAACGDNKLPLTDAAVPADAFQVDANPDELLVTSTEPSANAIVTDLESPIVLHFDRPIERDDIDGATLWAFGQWSGSHRGTYSFADDDTSVSMSHERKFIPGEQVTVVLANRLRGSDDVSKLRAGGYSFQFRVGSSPASMTFTEIANLDSRNDDSDPGQSYGGVAADLDLDGYPDITVVNERSEDLVVFMNRGDGTAMLDRKAGDYRVGIRPSPNESSDFNGDGQTDIAVANIGSGVSVLLGNGDGTFQGDEEYPSGRNPRGLAVLDANGDGHMDLANSNSGGEGGDLSVLLNDGNGAFGEPTIFDGGCNGEWALTSADMNLDGLLDLVVGCHTDGTIAVLTNDGQGNFNLRETSAGPQGLWMIVTGDLNGDGHADVTVAGGFSDNGAILLGSATGHLEDAVYYGTDPSTSATDIGDLDGDGDLDWVTSSFGGDNSDWFFWENDGTGTFTKITEWDSPEDASCALLVDLDLDGDLDLGLLDEADDRLILLRND